MQMFYASKKPAIYIIDGLNFIRSFLIKSGGSANEEALTAELISWLDELGGGELYGSQFRIILDGVYRSVGTTRTSCVNAQFADGCSADEIICEQASYLKQSGERVIVITSDLELGAKIKQFGVKVIGCGKFFNSFYK